MIVKIKLPFGGRALCSSAFTIHTSSRSPAISLRADSSYLITGGLGGLGLELQNGWQKGSPAPGTIG